MSYKTSDFLITSEHHPLRNTRPSTFIRVLFILSFALGYRDAQFDSFSCQFLAS